MLYFIHGFVNYSIFRNCYANIGTNMRIIQDSIWNVAHNYDAICCTTNAVVKKNGELVMGAGIAKEFAHKYPWLPKYWGQKVRRKIDTHVEYPGTILTILKSAPHLVYFQTKDHWKDSSNLDIIVYSTQLLCKLIDIACFKKVLLPKPGCSNGGLDWDKEVYPILNPLFLSTYPEIDIIERP